MHDTYLRAFGLIGLALLVVVYFMISVPQEIARKDALTFSNTATWEAEALAMAGESFRYPAEIYSSIYLDPPPKNSSRETSDEIALLKSYTALRTTQELQDIFSEVQMESAYFGGKPLTTYMDASQFPATATLLKDSFYDLEVVEMQQKKKFDRVRPSLLDPSLETVIAVPEFPAYPSYHSSEAYFIAYTFSELAPARGDEFVARADQIAKNREIAGVHYPSDTAAGKLLAQQFFDIMMQNPKFLTLLEAARAEWR